MPANSRKRTSSQSHRPAVDRAKIKMPSNGNKSREVPVLGYGPLYENMAIPIEKLGRLEEDERGRPVK